MTRILVLGGSYLQSDFVNMALKYAHEVHVLDRNPNCFLADNHDIDFSCVDISDVEAVDAYFISKGCDVVLSPITEVGNRVAAVISAKHGLLYNSIEAVIATTDKNVMRRRLEHSNLLEPRVIRLGGESVQNLQNLEFPYPVIVKPSISSASRGVTLVRDFKELEAAVDRAAPYINGNSEILVEEFIQGEQFSIETISGDGKHHIVAIVKEELSDAPYYMERNDIIDLEKNELLFNDVQQFINELLNSIGITTGPCHTEVKIDNDNNIRLIEIASRSGLLRDRLIRAAGGEEYNELILRSYLGEEVSNVKLPRTNALLGIIAYESDFRVFNLAVENGLVVDSYLNGAQLTDHPTMLTDAVGYFFISSKNAEIFNNYKVKV